MYKNPVVLVVGSLFLCLSSAFVDAAELDRQACEGLAYGYRSQYYSSAEYRKYKLWKSRAGRLTGSAKLAADALNDYELDFVVEANNTGKIAENMAEIPEIVIPKIYKSLSKDVRDYRANRRAPPSHAS